MPANPWSCTSSTVVRYWTPGYTQDWTAKIVRVPPPSNSTLPVHELKDKQDPRGQFNLGNRDILSRVWLRETKDSYGEGSCSYTGVCSYTSVTIQASSHALCTAQSAGSVSTLCFETSPVPKLNTGSPVWERDSTRWPFICASAANINVMIYGAMTRKWFYKVFIYTLCKHWTALWQWNNCMGNSFFPLPPPLPPPLFAFLVFLFQSPSSSFFHPPSSSFLLFFLLPLLLWSLFLPSCPPNSASQRLKTASLSCCYARGIRVTG